ncbi:hypothetical protein DdX_20163 [Ditylenchus destructor]|uniref:Secreted protein n=1 Tax=Ditylenchus destructor TaxID=166010 RepID=A0AAD4ML98_9BILA|nr:hypothetical protein DdX_20163 [Ditylenchus destructor]
MYSLLNCLCLLSIGLVILFCNEAYAPGPGGYGDPEHDKYASLLDEDPKYLPETTGTDNDHRNIDHLNKITDKNGIHHMRTSQNHREKVQESKTEGGQK